MNFLSFWIVLTLTEGEIKRGKTYFFTHNTPKSHINKKYVKGMLMGVFTILSLHTLLFTLCLQFAPHIPHKIEFLEFLSVSSSHRHFLFPSVSIFQSVQSISNQSPISWLQSEYTYKRSEVPLGYTSILWRLQLPSRLTQLFQAYRRVLRVEGSRVIL